MSETDLDLPKAVIKRIVKSKLQQAAGDPEGKKVDYQINKDALLAFSESAKVFISYIASTANEICKEHARQTISGDDVFEALQDVDFGEFVAPLREHLAAYKAAAKEKNKKKEQAKSNRKRKQGEGEPQEEEAAKGPKEAADPQEPMQEDDADEAGEEAQE